MDGIGTWPIKALEALQGTWQDIFCRTVNWRFWWGLYWFQNYDVKQIAAGSNEIDQLRNAKGFNVKFMDEATSPFSAVAQRLQTGEQK